jgi:hypothetical protein
VEIF